MWWKRCGPWMRVTLLRGGETTLASAGETRHAGIPPGLYWGEYICISWLDHRNDSPCEPTAGREVMPSFYSMYSLESLYHRRAAVVVPLPLCRDIVAEFDVTLNEAVALSRMKPHMERLVGAPCPASPAPYSSLRDWVCEDDSRGGGEGPPVRREVGSGMTAAQKEAVQAEPPVTSQLCRSSSHLSPRCIMFCGKLVLLPTCKPVHMTRQPSKSAVGHGRQHPQQ